MKLILSGLALVGCVVLVQAHPALAPADSIPAATPLQCRQVVEQEANVRFPQRLSEHADASRDYVEQFARHRRDYIIRMHQRGKSFFPRIQKIFDQYRVPREFQVLIALESAFNPKAISGAGAVGYWQIMDAVAREYGMKITAHVIPGKSAYTASQKRKPVKNSPAPKQVSSKAVTDDRMHFVKSTRVAARYLSDRRRNLQDDWLLIAASYNCGVGTVWQALEQSKKPNPGFWDIKHLLPAETRAYVMNFIALNVIFHNYDAFYRKQLRFRDKTCLEPVQNSGEPIARNQD